MRRCRSQCYRAGGGSDEVSSMATVGCEGVSVSCGGPLDRSFLRTRTRIAGMFSLCVQAPSQHPGSLLELVVSLSTTLVAFAARQRTGYMDLGYLPATAPFAVIELGIMRISATPGGLITNLRTHWSTEAIEQFDVPSISTTGGSTARIGGSHSENAPILALQLASI